MKVFRTRWVLLSAIALIAVIILTLIAAPTTNKLNSGSTYSRAPDGYGAWYTFMLERGTPIQRWQKPFEQLKEKSAIATQNPLEFEGTYPFPEAQLDRFLFKLVVDYPDAVAEKQMLFNVQRGFQPKRPYLESLQPIATV